MISFFLLFEFMEHSALQAFYLFLVHLNYHLMSRYNHSAESRQSIKNTNI